MYISFEKKSQYWSLVKTIYLKIMHELFWNTHMFVLTLIGRDFPMPLKLYAPLQGTTLLMNYLMC